jgi:hypothetical protein
MSLNAGQRSALEVQMRLLETALLEIRRALRDPSPDAMLTHYKPLQPSLAERMEPLIDRMLSEIGIIAGQFHLRPDLMIVGRYIRAQMAGAWSDLQDMRVAKLRRYGAVNPSLYASLEPRLKNLIALTMEAERIVDEDPETRAPASRTKKNTSSRREK